MARTLIRSTATVGAFGLALLAMSPAVAATDNQAGATAFFLKIADQDGQGTGIATATYENGQETKTGETEPPFPQPAQNAFKAGVLVQEATAQPNFSAACAGLGGDGTGVALTIGDSSCLKRGNAITGSLGSFDIASLIAADPSKTPGIDQVPEPLKTALLATLGGGAALQTTITDAVDDAIAEAKKQFGDGGLVADLDLVEGSCLTTGGVATGDTRLTNARIALNIPGRDPLVLVNLPSDPDPNTHVFTNLSKVLTLVLEAVRTDLEDSLDGAGGPLGAAIDAIEDNVVTNIRTQLEANLKPLEQNLLDITLNFQDPVPPTDSIRVRALNVDVLPAAKEQLSGNPVANLQIGSVTCAPVARTAAVSPPQADAPVVSPPKAATPTGVSSGLATAPGTQSGIDASTWALLALGALGLTGAGFVGARRLHG